MKILGLWNDMVLITIMWVMFFTCFSGLIIVYLVNISHVISLSLLFLTAFSLIALLYSYHLFIDDYKKVEKRKMNEEIKNISYIGFDDSCWVEMVCLNCGEKFKEWCGSSGVIFKCPKCNQKYKYEVYVGVSKINGEEDESEKSKTQ